MRRIGRELLTFFSRCRKASCCPVFRRARGVEKAVKGSFVPFNTNFRASKKCPIRRRFRNRAQNTRAMRARRRDSAGEVASRPLRTWFARRESLARTRFVNVEAVFFVLL
jgi:hypothetical protein